MDSKPPFGARSDGTGVGVELDVGTCVVSGPLLVLEAEAVDVDAELLVASTVLLVVTVLVDAKSDCDCGALLVLSTLDVAGDDDTELVTLTSLDVDSTLNAELVTELLVSETLFEFELEAVVLGIWLAVSATLLVLSASDVTEGRPVALVVSVTPLAVDEALLVSVELPPTGTLLIDKLALARVELELASPSDPVLIVLLGASALELEADGEVV